MGVNAFGWAYFGEAFAGPASGRSASIIIQKTGAAATAVMQKAASGWTYVTGKTGTSAAALMQKAQSGWWKVRGN